MAKCSLLSVRPDDKRRVGSQHENVTQIGEMAGIRFVKLRHFKGPRNGDQALRGFQRTDLSMVTDRRTGRPAYEIEHSQIAGVDCDGLLPLVFNEDPLDGQLYAYVPDTSFNRKMLICAFFEGAEFEIVDKRIAHEVEEKYKALEVEIVKEKTKDDVIEATKEQLDASLTEMAVLKAENERLKKIAGAAAGPTPSTKTEKANGKP